VLVVLQVQLMVDLIHKELIWQVLEYAEPI
jgi:hypothetical protein